MSRARLVLPIVLLACAVAVLAMVPAALAAGTPDAAACARLGVDPASTTVVHLSGSPAARGLAYGRAAAPLIRANVASFKASATAAGYSYAGLRARALAAARYLPRAERVQLRAMARAAGVSYAAVLTMNRFSETVDGLATLDATATGGGNPDSCTQFIIAGARSADGRTIASKNRDASKPQVLLISAATKTTYGFIAVQKAGEYGVSFGLNDKGVCVGNNWLPTPTTYDPGFGEEEINRQVIEKCASVDAAISYVTTVPKNHGTCVMVADKAGGAFIEAVTSGQGYTPEAVATRVTSGALVHTNMYIYEPYKSWVINDGFGYWWTPGVARYDRALQLLAENPQPLTADDIQGFNRDLVDFGDGQPAAVEALHPEVPSGCWSNGGAGYSICNSATRASGVFVIDKTYPGQLSTMWMSIYNPAWCGFTPVHNAVLGQIATASTGFAPFTSTTVWNQCQTLQKGPHPWGYFIPTYDAWEGAIAQPQNATAEAGARSMLAKKNTSGATLALTNSDVAISQSLWTLIQGLK